MLHKYLQIPIWQTLLWLYRPCIFRQYVCTNYFLLSFQIVYGIFAKLGSLRSTFSLFSSNLHEVQGNIYESEKITLDILIIDELWFSGKSVESFGDCEPFSSKYLTLTNVPLLKAEFRRKAPKESHWKAPQSCRFC